METAISPMPASRMLPRALWKVPPSEECVRRSRPRDQTVQCRHSNAVFAVLWHDSRVQCLHFWRRKHGLCHSQNDTRMSLHGGKWWANHVVPNKWVNNLWKTESLRKRGLVLFSSRTNGYKWIFHDCGGFCLQDVQWQMLLTGPVCLPECRGATAQPWDAWRQQISSLGRTLRPTVSMAWWVRSNWLCRNVVCHDWAILRCNSYTLS